MTTIDWNVTVGLGDVNPETFDISQFEDWGGVLAPAPQGGMQLTLTVPADSLRAAAVTGLSIATGAGLTPSAVDALSAEDFDRRSVLTAPDTVGVPEAARLLGVTEQAVRQRIQTGSLPARREGRDWRIPRPLVEHELVDA